ncbi:CBS domain-containing protein [Desulfurococcus mucosus]|uniref:CBS domain containing protein n=1 Tax=Desulfurococcus mucosus (strain ATCC 35584 / DSM 2162 / JCM 9187 / O7/1) TaxID=765177 RepID=E8R7J5_DESM0|nr:CBS domain-containing protein [Desulfurococcus mucosus]ADV64490.1 CBS domain containing protein [Desulfurococcus mucosus DSM 2162]
MSLAEFIDPDPLVVDKNDSLSTYLRLLSKRENDKAVVMENRRINGRQVKTVAGVVTGRDILGKIVSERLRLSSPGRLRVSGFMSTQPFTIKPDASIRDALTAMASKSIGILPVVDGFNFKGAVYRRSLLKLAFHIGDPASKAASRVFLRTRLGDSLLMLRQSMLESGEGFAVVVDDEGKPCGYITVMDLAYAFATFLENVPEKHRKERISELVVRDYYRRDLPVVKEDAELGRVAETLYEKRSRGVLVTGERGVVGVVREHDLISYLALTSLGIG